MQLSKKISSSISLLIFMCIVNALVVAGYFWWPYFRNHVVHFKEVGFIAIVSFLMLTMILSMSLMLFIIRNIIKPLQLSIAFIESLSNGDMPPALKEPADNSNDEISSLFVSLNLLRDRQQNLSNKLKKSLMREAEGRKELQNCNKLQQQILIRLLPELRMPLSTIKGYAQVVRLMAKNGDCDTQKILQYLDEVGVKTGSMSRQIERMLDIGNLGLRSIESIEYTDISVPELMRELLDANSFALQERNIKLVNGFRTNMPDVISLDRSYIKEIMNILIRGLARAAGSGETISVYCYKDRGRIVFEVRDARHVSMREDLVASYESAVKSESISNLGRVSLNVLGLVFVREMLEKINGEFVVEHDCDCHVSIKVKFAESSVTSDRAKAESWWGSNAVTRFDATHPVSGKHVPVKCILCDDDHDSPVILNALYASENISITTVRTFDELLAHLEPDRTGAVIIADHLLKGNINEAIDRIRAKTESPVPIVLVSNAIAGEKLTEINHINKVYGMTRPVNYLLLANLLRS